MTLRLFGVTSALVSTVALATITGQGAGGVQSTTPPPNTQTSRAASGDQVTVTGCVQKEEDYRRTAGAGRGGAASTGVGLGNEFVLSNASMSGAGGSAATATSGAGAPAATGTGGSAARGTAYELSGANESKAAAFVGKRVEITGMLKPAEVGGAGPTGGPTASAPLSQDLKLRELDVATIRETTGSCTAP